MAVGLAAGAVGIRRESADVAGVHSQGWSFEVDAAWTPRPTAYYGAELGGILMVDRAPFFEPLVGGGSGKSGTAGVLFSVLGGARTRPSNRLGSTMSLGLLGGVTKVWAERAVENCIGCRREDLDLGAGLFLQPTVWVGRRLTRLRVGSRYYLGDGMRYLLSVGLELGQQ